MHRLRNMQGFWNSSWVEVYNKMKIVEIMLLQYMYYKNQNNIYPMGKKACKYYIQYYGKRCLLQLKEYDDIHQKKTST